MSAREPRFEIVRGPAAYHARFRAKNGRIVWVTETYKERRHALRVVLTICGVQEFYRSPFQTHREVPWGASRTLIEVQEVDERE